ncbi:tail fiber domain-containing protein, partial [Gemella haemolysans]|uniref:tail fiber domain-containing protein n=1 Tax=Gemella haemolysans TaxID=1379 RepID=UPI00232DC4E3
YGLKKCVATIKIPDSNKEIEFVEPMLQQWAVDNFTTYNVKNVKVYKKKSAELIVDGSIEGRQIKTNTLETGHHKAGSITSEIIAAKAVKVNNLLVDDAMIQEFVAHKAFISKLWAQDAFIKSLQTVKISATQLDTDWLSAYTGDIGGFRIGKNPNQPGDFWLTGSNNFNCGLNPGHNIGTRGAQIWAAWGNNWYQAGPNAWYVNGNGAMVCNATAVFNRGLDVHGRHIYTHDQDIYGQGAGSSTTKVMWWSQINRVKSAISDKRLKTNVKPTKVKAVDLLNKIEIVEFNWKKDNKFEKIGAIAQQVQSVEESLVVYDMDDKQTYNDYLRINYYDTIPYLIKAVQELSEENNKLKNKLEELING